MYRIRRFGVIKTATIVALMYVLLIGIVFIPAAIIVGLAGVTSSTAGAGAVALLVGGALVAILYAAIGWVFTAIACVIYNVAAGWVGGIEVQVESVTPPPAQPVWGPPAASPPAWGPPASPPPAGPPPGSPPPAP